MYPERQLMKVSKMNMPGFTANISLFNAAGRYHTTVRHAAGSTNVPAVLPQLARQMDLLLCLQGCSLTGSDPACTDTCYRQEHIRSSDDFGRGGSGGGRSGPDLVCSPCRNGRQRCGIPGVGVSTVSC